MIRIAQGYALTDPAHVGMFEDRKRLFVDLMRWDVPVTPEGHEIDQFDGESAVYILDTDADGRHLGSLRLLPTMGPHILGDLFPRLALGGVPTGADTLEITRLCLPTRLGAARRLHVRNRLISAMVDLCLMTGIRELTGVVRPGFRDQVLAMGWDAEALGPIMEIDGMPLGAFCIDLDGDTPYRLGLNGIYTATGAAPIVQAVSAQLPVLA